MKRLICVLMSLAVSATILFSVQFPTVAAGDRWIVFSSERGDGCLTREEVAQQLESAAFGAEDIFLATCDNSVVSIGDSAFEYCTQLSGMSLPSRLTAIGVRAFYGSGLAEIELPDSIKSIEANAFGGGAVTLVANQDSYAWQYAQEQRISVRPPHSSSLSVLSADPVEETLFVGSSLSLSEKAVLAAHTPSPYNWVSDHPEVAMVSDSGQVTALSAGEALIGMETLSGMQVVGEITVMSEPVLVTGITIRNAPKSILKGKTLTLKVKVTPSGATNQNISWATSDASILKVEKSGKITAVAPGKAVITATAKDGSGSKASCIIEVQSYITLKIGKTMAVQNGSRTTVDNTGAKPFKVGGKTMLPLRFLGEKLGGRVKYKDDASPITMTFGEKTVSFSLGKNLMRVTSGTTDKTVLLETPAQKKGGRTYIPLRAIGQALGFTVYYESGEELIIVSSASMSKAVRSARLKEYRQAEKAAFNEFVDLAIQYAEKQPQYPVNQGKTIYGALFGNPYGAWCTEFVLWCFYQAEKDLGTDYIGTVYPWRDNSVSCGTWFGARNRRFFRSSGYIPKRGDMIFYNYGTRGSTDHTGLVTGTIQKNGVTYVQTIEGNIPSDSVKQIRRLSLPLNSSKIVSYGSCRGQ